MLKITELIVREAEIQIKVCLVQAPMLSTKCLIINTSQQAMEVKLSSCYQEHKA